MRTGVELLLLAVGYMVVAVFVLFVIGTIIYGVVNAYKSLISISDNVDNFIESFDEYKKSFLDALRDEMSGGTRTTPDVKEEIEVHEDEYGTMIRYCRCIREEAFDEAFKVVCGLISSHMNPVPNIGDDGSIIESYYKSINDIARRTDVESISIPILLKDNDMALLSIYIPQLIDYSKWKVQMHSQCTENGIYKYQVPLALKDNGDTSVYLTAFQVVYLIDTLDADEVIVNARGGSVVATLFKTS